MAKWYDFRNILWCIDRRWDALIHSYAFLEENPLCTINGMTIKEWMNQNVNGKPRGQVISEKNSISGIVEIVKRCQR